MAGVNPMAMNPTLPQVIGILPHVRYEIESLLQTPNHDEMNTALVESVQFRRMAHARVLFDFFTKSRSAPKKERLLSDDDVVSEDFGFPAEPLYGPEPKPLLDRFNKDLFHLTYSRLTRTAEVKPWPREKLLPPVEAQARKFIEHILQASNLSIPEDELGKWRELKEADRRKLPLRQNTSNIAIPRVMGIQAIR